MMKFGDGRPGKKWPERKKAQRILKEEGSILIKTKMSQEGKLEHTILSKSGEDKNLKRDGRQRSKIPETSEKNKPVITWEQPRPDSDAIIYGNLKKRPLKNWGAKANQKDYARKEQKHLGVVVETNKNTRRRSGQKPPERA